MEPEEMYKQESEWLFPQVLGGFHLRLIELLLRTQGETFPATYIYSVVTVICLSEQSVVLLQVSR